MYVFLFVFLSPVFTHHSVPVAWFFPRFFVFLLLDRTGQTGRTDGQNTYVLRSVVRASAVRVICNNDDAISLGLSRKYHYRLFTLFAATKIPPCITGRLVLKWFDGVTTGALQLLNQKVASSTSGRLAIKCLL